jgi:FkbM family methyltransferase
MTIRQTASKSRDLLRDDGVAALALRACDKYFPDPISGRLALLIDEQAVGILTDAGHWDIRRLPNLTTDRHIHRVGETVFGTHHGSKRHRRMLERVYTYEGFVEFGSQDSIVVDVGAYVGAFTQVAAQQAESVIAIEPLAAVTEVLDSNLSDVNNATVIGKAAWNTKDTIEMNRSVNANETSILSPDTNATGTSFSVQADTVPDIVRSNGHNHIDYLKIEAEGVEPEILEAALNDGMDIEKIAIDAGPERDGDRVIDEITALLDAHGYDWRMKSDEVVHGEDIVFARLVN